jgi:hypothetical protein
MGTKRIDPFDRRIRRPKNLMEARIMGEASIEVFKAHSLRKHPELDPLPKETLEYLKSIGHRIGETMFREKSPWTLNIIVERFNKIIAAI